MLRLLVCFLCLPLFAFAKPRQVVGRPVPDNFRALTPDKQRLTGILGSRIRANGEGFLQNIDLEELIRPLQGQTQAAGSVERNFAGQFLDAAADAFEYNHNPQLRDRMDRVAAELAAFANRATASTNTRLDEAGLTNARFDMLGLLAYSRATGQSGGYLTAQSIASSTLKLLSSQTKQETSTQQSWTLAEAGLIEPFVQLYRRSGIGSIWISALVLLAPLLSRISLLPRRKPRSSAPSPLSMALPSCMKSRPTQPSCSRSLLGGSTLK